MRGIGIVGTENSHVDAFLRELNLEDRHPGFAVTALVGVDARTAELAATAGIPTILSSAEELLGRVDAVMVCSRDGALHRGLAEPLLLAGVPTFVDKPLATSVEDARALVAAAERGGAPLVTGSIVRSAPEIGELRSGPRPTHVTLAGPADPHSEYSGLWFYGIHHVEASLELLGNPVIDSPVTVSVARSGGAVTATTVLGSVSVTYSFLPPDPARRQFHATVVAGGAVQGRDLTLTPDSYAELLMRFVRSCEDSTAGMDADRLLAPVKVMGAVAEALHVTYGEG